MRKSPKKGKNGVEGPTDLVQNWRDNRCQLTPGRQKRSNSGQKGRFCERSTKMPTQTSRIPASHMPLRAACQPLCAPCWGPFARRGVHAEGYGAARRALHPAVTPSGSGKRCFRMPGAGPPKLIWRLFTTPYLETSHQTLSGDFSPKPCLETFHQILSGDFSPNLIWRPFTKPYLETSNQTSIWRHVWKLRKQGGRTGGTERAEGMWHLR